MNQTLIHPILVHFPIALLIAGAGVALFASLFRNTRFRKGLKVFAAWSVILGAVSACLALASGFLFTNAMTGLMGELQNTHMLLAVASVACSLFSAVCMYLYLRRNNSISRVRNYWSYGLFTSLITAMLVGLTGHCGGLMVFGL